MIETLDKIKDLTAEAREFDPVLIGDGRAAIVGRNLGQIEGRDQERGRVYVHRLAGKSGDVIRKSRTAMHVEWLGATTFEHPPLLALAKEFYEKVFAAAETVKPLIIRRGFWEIDEESECFRAARRTAVVSGDNRRVLELTLALERNEQEIKELQRLRPMAAIR